MEFQHTSVLLKESIEGLQIIPDGIYADGTLGAGGHASEICQSLSSKGILVGIDQDQDAINQAQKVLNSYKCVKHYVKDNYSNIKNIIAALEIKKLNGAILDLGVSSFQLDNPERGFSYMKDAPLDMRMDQSTSFTAEDVVNEYSEQELHRIIRDYGEERWAARIAGFIVNSRKKQRLSSTGELVNVIKAAVPSSARRDGPHPAKRTFQAIRIEVNGELVQLKKAVTEFIDVLDSKGRLVIITFHSLEDRIVKEIFQHESNPCSCPPHLPICVCGQVPRVKKVTKKPIVATSEEVNENPRARSAKLRIIERI